MQLLKVAFAPFTIPWNAICHPHTVICRNPKYFFGAKISIGLPVLNFFQCIVAEYSGLPFFCKWGRKVSNSREPYKVRLQSL